MQLIGATAVAAGVGSSSRKVLAGPFDENEYRQVIPIDKRLDEDWVRSLYARGEKQTWSEPNALAKIGMPVGGFFAGTVYLSGNGRLWYWDIFNRDEEGVLPREGIPIELAVLFSENRKRVLRTRDGLNYVSPAKLTQPFEIGFNLSVNGNDRPIDASGFSTVTFNGKYPIGEVDFSDPNSPVSVQLNAFSPFIPLNVDDSSLPATVMSYEITNESDQSVRINIGGRMQNPVCLKSAKLFSGKLVNSSFSNGSCSGIAFSALPPEESNASAARNDIPITSFESDSYGDWETTGNAFGDGPIAKPDVPDYQGDLGFDGQHGVNSHATAPGANTGEKDRQIGTLTSPPFKIERKFIRFLIGGGRHTEKTCLNLIVDDQIVASATGNHSNKMSTGNFSVATLEGRIATLQVVDQHTGAWGNIGVDQIVQTDTQPVSNGKLELQSDFGTMTLSAIASGALIDLRTSQEGKTTKAETELGSPLVGSVSQSFSLAAGETRTATFLVTWHFPNFFARGLGSKVEHSYAVRHTDALTVANYVADAFERLSSQTRQWVDTWYDSSLPYWLLDRTMANTSTLATTTCYRLGDGRFWAWEGIGCCPGTCTHVWHYAQAVGRLFPEIERDTRERVDFGLAQHADGGIGMRANLTNSNRAAHDGQCGRILGAYREHQMTTDDRFLKRNWQNIKKAIEFMIALDPNRDGMIEGAQPNTLDAEWFGKISFLASLYLAALRAGQAMATEVGDDDFAAQCKRIAELGAESILETYNGEFFAQIEDPAHRKDIGIGPGCYIDQVFGQTWAHWVGLGYLFDREKQLSALRSLWNYNFVPDVGVFRQNFVHGRWYAMAGDAGTIMCSWPKGGENPNFANHWQYGYFNECMSGFESQAAAHMIWEGIDQPDLLEHGLAICRSIHDRYDASLRNPYNEIECSDHYSRAMASYGVFQAVCGFEYHGPKGEIGFAPRISPEKFSAPFVTAAGWGTFAQTITAGQLTAGLHLKWGSLRLTTFVINAKWVPIRVDAEVNGAKIAADVRSEDGRTVVEFATDLELENGDRLSLMLC